MNAKPSVPVVKSKAMPVELMNVLPASSGINDAVVHIDFGELHVGT